MGGGDEKKDETQAEQTEQCEQGGARRREGREAGQSDVCQGGGQQDDRVGCEVNEIKRKIRSQRMSSDRDVHLTFKGRVLRGSDVIGT